MVRASAIRRFTLVAPVDNLKLSQMLHAAGREETEMTTTKGERRICERAGEFFLV